MPFGTNFYVYYSTPQALNDTQMQFFDEQYYRTLMEAYKYAPVHPNLFTFAIGDLTPKNLTSQFLCHVDAERFRDTPRHQRIVTTGFGMSGAPHLGTLMQVMRIRTFAQAGENTQIVLGDIDAHTGKRVPYNTACALADRYESFLHSSGLVLPSTLIRNQRGNIDSLAAAFCSLTAITEDDFADIEEDNHPLYVQQGIVESTMTLPRKMSLLLMASDFWSLAQNYKTVMVMLGVDEHRYVRFADSVGRRLTDSEGLSSTALTCIYTRMLPGLNGFPKMSKSIPSSGISLSMPDTQIFDILMSEAERRESALICDISSALQVHSPSDLADIREQWHRHQVRKNAAAAVAQAVTKIKIHWQRSA